MMVGNEDAPPPSVGDERRRETLSAYSLPPLSYYVPPTDESDCPEKVSKPLLGATGMMHGSESVGKGGASNAAHDDSRSCLKKRSGLFLEQQRYLRESNKPHVISMWDQVCVLHLFPGMFEGTIDYMELFCIIKMALMVTINCVTVAINVFYGTETENLSAWSNYMSKGVFFLEFSVVYFLLFFLIIVILHACKTDNVGAKLAGDIAALSDKISNFSVFRAVSIVSPDFFVVRILPMAQNAMYVSDYLRVAVLSVLWLCVCVLAILTVVLKLTQVSFVTTKDFFGWSFSEIIQLIGLTLNFARLDGSYEAELQVLLDAVHGHFCAPGVPKDGLNRPECLYTRVCDRLSIPRFAKYEFFDVIFNYHFKYKESGEEAGMRMKMRKMLNYLAFILRMDESVLRRFLQMSQSPLPFFQSGRDSFIECFKKQDFYGMRLAIWRSDPASLAVRKFARRNKNGFCSYYVCEEGREMWGEETLPHINVNSISERKFYRDIRAACRSFS